MPNGHTEPERITAVEVGLRDLKEDVTEIKDNHLVHLQNKVDLIQNQMSKYAGALVLGQVILGIALWYFGQ